MPPRRCTPTSTPLLAAALLAAPLALAPGVLTGCGSTPPPRLAADAGPGADYQTGYPVEPGHARELGYDVRWVHDLPLEPGQSVAHVFEDEDTLIAVEAPVNIVTALDPASGATRWKTVVGSRLETVVGMTSDDRSVYVNTTTRVFQLARRGGAVKGISDLQYPVNASPLKVGRLAIFGADVGNVFAHHLDDGFTKWAYGLGSPIQAASALAERELFAVDAAGRYAMLDTNTGKLLWRGQFYAGVSADPIIHEGFVIVASEDQSLYSLEQVNGKDRWPAFRSETRLTHAPLAHGNRIFLHEPGVGLSAIDAETGERVWRFGGDVQPFSADGAAVLARGEGVLVSLGAADGGVRTSVPTRRLILARSDDGGRLLVCSAGGSLMRLSPAAAADAAPSVIEAPSADAPAEP